MNSTNEEVDLLDVTGSPEISVDLLDTQDIDDSPHPTDNVAERPTETMTSPPIDLLDDSVTHGNPENELTADHVESAPPSNTADYTEDEVHHIQSQFVDSPFDDESDDDAEDEDVDEVQKQYVDSPFDDHMESEPILETDGILKDETMSKTNSAPTDEMLSAGIGAMYGDGDPEISTDDEVIIDEPPKRRMIRRLRRRQKEDTTTNRRRRRRWIWAWLCCCMLLLLIVMILGFIVGFTEDSDDPEDDNFDDDENIDDDWTLYKPFEGITTTPMDPFDENDCDFSDNIFPHVKAQCRCYGKIVHVPDDVQALKEEVHSEINREIYDDQYFPEADSCDPANQALIWLSSGDTRDAGDFYQRYVLTASHLALNGTNWDVRNGWMSDDTECFWIGLSCNSRWQIHNFASDANNLIGKFPTELVKLYGLRTLAMSRNHITGSIPTEVFGMRNLENLHLYANQMRGKIPPDVKNAKKMKSMLLGNNLFFGTLVTELGEVTTLEELGMGFNEFWRKVPTELGLLTNLKWLVMEENRFSGRMPTEIGRLSHLEYWLMSNNLMHGDLPIELANLSHLREWRLSNTGLGGVFPTEFGTAMSDLFRLEMGKNNFEGKIMTEFGLMTHLSWLALNGNDFTGTIPTEFGNLLNMTRLSLQDNLIDGNIPSEFGNLEGLRDLTLDKTSLTGKAPDEVCALRSKNLKLFITDCEARGDVGIECDIPHCCSFCRRGESANN